MLAVFHLYAFKRVLLTRLQLIAHVNLLKIPKYLAETPLPQKLLDFVVRRQVHERDLATNQAPEDRQRAVFRVEITNHASALQTKGYLPRVLVKPRNGRSDLKVKFERLPPYSIFRLPLHVAMMRKDSH